MVEALAPKVEMRCLEPPDLEHAVRTFVSRSHWALINQLVPSAWSRAECAIKQGSGTTNHWEPPLSQRSPLPCCFWKAGSRLESFQTRSFHKSSKVSTQVSSHISTKDLSSQASEACRVSRGPGQVTHFGLKPSDATHVPKLTTLFLWLVNQPKWAKPEGRWLNGDDLGTRMCCHGIKQAESYKLFFSWFCLIAEHLCFEKVWRKSCEPRLQVSRDWGCL